jgi:uncharacterized protein
VDDQALIDAQLGRPARGVVRVAARCPFGAPAVTEQRSYLADGEPFPTTYYLTCPYAVRQVSALEDSGGVARFEQLVREDEGLAASLAAATARQRTLRAPAERMADRGASLALGIGGTARDGDLKCLHAHVAFALAEPGYELGDRMAAEAGPLFPTDRCCTA